MFQYIRIFLIVSVVCGLCSCKDKAKEHKDELREGSWYVYDIEYDYEFYNRFATPQLASYIQFLLDERNLLFLPGDELTFSNKWISVRCPNDRTYSYRYYFWGKYIRIEVDHVDYPINPNGDNNDMRLRFDKNALRQLLSETDQKLLNDLENNLKKFYIDYKLQRPLPPIAQIMEGTYRGELYDGTNQLLNQTSTLYLFWENGSMNLSLEDKIQLENGPFFYIEIPNLTVKDGFTPGSYTFSGNQKPNADTQVSVEGRISTNGVLEMDATIDYKGTLYDLHYLKGVRQWEPRSLSVQKSEQIIHLQAR